jgi:hypothetical protein
MATLEEVLSKYGVESDSVKNAENVLTPLELYMRDASQVFIDLMKQKLQDEGANASFRLSQGLDYETVKEGDGLNSTFYSEEDYAEQRDQGVSGTRRKRDTPFSFSSEYPSQQMITDIASWIRAKGFTAPEWAVATNVLKYGYEGAGFIEHAFSDSNLDKMNNDILVVVANTVDGIMTKVIPEFK